MSCTGDVRGLVETLLAIAERTDPEGDGAQRFRRIKWLIDNGVVLSVATQRFLDLSIELLLANIECRALTDLGACTEHNGAPCDHTDRFAACPEYDPARPLTGRAAREVNHG